jgi:Na+-transporting methylmalonyl-CoA/oxaloacetate decarboxylase gamma subunit
MSVNAVLGMVDAAANLLGLALVLLFLSLLLYIIANLPVLAPNRLQG